tara:strand:+ start:1343 stop:1957 length:615 start_codon:yes stop_codon:yes gene_type:complete
MTSKINKDKIILTDVDGVLLDFSAGFHEYMLQSDFEYNYTEKQDWKIYEQFSWTQDEKRQIMTDYAHSTLFSNIPAMECALDVLKGLKDDGWRFIAITSCMTGSEAQCYETTFKNRMDNLQAHFGNIFEDMHLATWDGGKGEFLSKYDPTWWVDDHIGHAHTGHEMGHKSVIMNSSMYSDEQNKAKLPVAQSWYCIKELIEKET